MANDVDGGKARVFEAVGLLAEIPGAGGENRQ
jgi:hypothetical protein